MSPHPFSKSWLALPVAGASSQYTLMPRHLPHDGLHVAHVRVIHPLALSCVVPSRSHSTHPPSTVSKPNPPLIIPLALAPSPALTNTASTAAPSNAPCDALNTNSMFCRSIWPTVLHAAHAARRVIR